MNPKHCACSVEAQAGGKGVPCGRHAAHARAAAPRTAEHADRMPTRGVGQHHNSRGGWPRGAAYFARWSASACAIARMPRGMVQEGAVAMNSRNEIWIKSRNGQKIHHIFSEIPTVKSSPKFSLPLGFAPEGEDCGLLR